MHCKEMSICLTGIQTLADELAKEENPEPDFSVPDQCDRTGEALLEIKNAEGKGKGFYAKQKIKAGTTILGAKPLCMVMQWEEDGPEDEMARDVDVASEEGIMKGSKRNGLLIIRAANAIKENPSIWFNQITKLFPRDATEELPIWMCEDAQTGMEIEAAVDALEEVNEFSVELVDEIRQRLPLIVRYNCLSFETAPELFVHPNQEDGGHVLLSGTGLYHYPSYFNHSHEPNVTRYAIGDVMFFVTNQDVKGGDELCISYIESEYLCESPSLRSKLLDMDFEESGDGEDGEGLGVVYPVIDLDMQDELMNMHPIERLNELKDLLQEASGNNTAVQGDDEEELHWFKCDVHQLRILLALAYDSLGQASKALEEWKHCISFVEKYLPPSDESGITIYVQAALCSHAAGQWGLVKKYAGKALQTHDLIFGGGVKFFRHRYFKEVGLKLRPESKKVLTREAALNVLWPDK